MRLRVYENREALGNAAAEQAAAAMQNAIARSGKARIIGASAASQFEFLDALIRTPGIDWKRVELFHLDEYIGLPMTHPASFCKFLQDRLISKTGITQYHLLNGEKDPATVIRNTNEAISSAPIDVAFVGIGENGHLAFNDPPADFETEEPYIVVNLDDACRRQQVGEGGSRICSLSHIGQFPCPSNRFCKPKKSWRWCRVQKKRQPSKRASMARSVPWRLLRSCARTQTPPFISIKNPQRC